MSMIPHLQKCSKVERDLDPEEWLTEDELLTSGSIAPAALEQPLFTAITPSLTSSPRND
jgi:hypothetical protein